MSVSACGPAEGLQQEYRHSPPSLPPSLPPSVPPLTYQVETLGKWNSEKISPHFSTSNKHQSIE